MKRKSLFFIIMFICHFAQAQTGSADKFIKSKLIAEGNSLPNIELPSTNNELINLNEFKGKYIVINFWALWCESCIYYLPLIQELIEEHKSDNIEFVFINVDESKEKWKNYVTKKKLKGTHLFANGTNTEPISDFLTKTYYDENGEISSITKGVPVYVLIDPNEIIIKNNIYMAEKEFRTILNKLL